MSQTIREYEYKRVHTGIGAYAIMKSDKLGISTKKSLAKLSLMRKIRGIEAQGHERATKLFNDCKTAIEIWSQGREDYMTEFTYTHPEWSEEKNLELIKRYGVHDMCDGEDEYSIEDYRIWKTPYGGDEFLPSVQFIYATYVKGIGVRSHGNNSYIL